MPAHPVNLPCSHRLGLFLPWSICPWAFDIFCYIIYLNKCSRHLGDLKLISSKQISEVELHPYCPLQRVHPVSLNSLLTANSLLKQFPYSAWDNFYSILYRYVNPFPTKLAVLIILASHQSSRCNRGAIKFSWMNKSVGEWFDEFLIKSSNSYALYLSELLSLKVFLVANLFSFGWHFRILNANIFQVPSHWSRCS